MKKYYGYYFSDLKKCNRSEDEYYTVEDLKAHVCLRSFDTLNALYESGADTISGIDWFVYEPGTDSCMPYLCESLEEAYKALCNNLNTDLYEEWHDL